MLLSLEKSGTEARPLVSRIHSDAIPFVIRRVEDELEVVGRAGAGMRGQRDGE